MSEQFGNYVDQGPESLESKQNLFYAARGNLFAALCGLMEGGPDREVAHMADVLYDYVFEIVDRFEEVTDHMLRDSDINGWIQFYLNDETAQLTEMRIYSGQLQYMPTDNDELRERALDYIEYADIRDQVEGNEADVYCDKILSTLNELIMEYAPVESQDAFMEAFASDGQSEGSALMVLTGNLQIDTVIEALNAHYPDSATLVQLKLARQFAEGQSDQDNQLPIIVDFDDAETQTEILDALRKRAADDDLDMFDRIAAEELIAIQQPAN